VPDVWLQIARVGNVFGMHYALDGRSWRMARFFSVPMPQTIKVGLVAQCPIGPGTAIDVLHFSIEQRTVKNLRSGI
jgi:regulation of enolase protein 1 (concanavalin A-like superfamily)